MRRSYGRTCPREEAQKELQTMRHEERGFMRLGGRRCTPVPPVKFPHHPAHISNPGSTRHRRSLRHKLVARHVGPRRLSGHGGVGGGCRFRAWVSDTPASGAGMRREGQLARECGRRGCRCCTLVHVGDRRWRTKRCGGLGDASGQPQ